LAQEWQRVENPEDVIIDEGLSAWVETSGSLYAGDALSGADDYDMEMQA
jgi:hypothetical protein